MVTRLIIAVAVALFFTPVIPLLAGEHPRNLQIPPSILPNAAGQPQRSTQTTQVSKADISTGIKKHIQSETKKSSDKKFHVNYQGKDLALNLVTVHDDRLSDLGRGKYFACVDMKATDGKTYDIDFFLTGQPGSMKVTETSVHKVNSTAAGCTWCAGICFTASTNFCNKGHLHYDASRTKSVSDVANDGSQSSFVVALRPEQRS